MKQGLEFFEKKNNFERYRDIPSVLKYGEASFNGQTEKPQISFVIPTYNREKLLGEAVESVLRQQQDEIKTELLIVDNGWFDLAGTYTEKILKKIPENRVKYFQNRRNIGMFGNWNRCIELASGEWIAFLHDDDILADDYLINAWHILQRYKSIDRIAYIRAGMFPLKNGQPYGGGFIKRKFWEWGKTHVVTYRAKDFAIAGPNNVGFCGVCSCGSLIKRSVYLENGGYDEMYYPSADAYYPEKLCTQYSYYMLGVLGPWGYYRMDDNTFIKEHALMAYARGYMAYEQYYKDRDELSRKMYRLFGKEMKEAYKEMLLSWDSMAKKNVHDVVQTNIDEIMGQDIKYGKMKLWIYKKLWYLWVRGKQLSAFLRLSNHISLYMK